MAETGDGVGAFGAYPVKLKGLPARVGRLPHRLPMAADGEVYLNLAKVLSNSGKKAEAKAAAQKALDKGVKKPEDAKGILSR